MVVTSREFIFLGVRIRGGWAAYSAQVLQQTTFLDPRSLVNNNIVPYHRLVQTDSLAGETEREEQI